MFKNEKIAVIDLRDRSIKLVDDKGSIVSLLFIRDNKLIIRGELVALDSTIEAPEIKTL